jgi:hypothetical protein
MLGAMLILVAVIVGFVVARNLNSTDPSNPAPTVDYGQTVKYARQQSGFDLVAPRRLPAGWRATSVRFTPRPDEHWHLGVLTDQGKYVGLEQGNGSVGSMVASYVDPHASRAKSVTIDGTPWSGWSDTGGDHALVHRAGGTTTLVVGTVAPAVLADYVRSLR